MEAHSFDKRHQAWVIWQSGAKKSLISRDLVIDYDTVCDWCKRFKAEGEAGLLTRYSNCGQRKSTSNPIKDKAVALRTLHEDWGGGYIRVNLLREFAGEAIAQPRQIQRWIAEAGLHKKKTKLPPVPTDWSRKPLERVQVDAKEQLKTKDGKPCCYLNFTDESTGSVLDAFVFPLGPNQSGRASRRVRCGKISAFPLGLHRWIKSSNSATQFRPNCANNGGLISSSHVWDFNKNPGYVEQTNSNDRHQTSVAAQKSRDEAIGR